MCSLKQLTVACAFALSGQAWSYGYYNWYDGYSVSVAANGSSAWSYSPSYSGWGWGWGGGGGVSYANTYARVPGQSDADSSAGWGGASSMSYASNYNGSYAYATAYAQNSSWWSGAYTRTYTATRGYGSYAYARATNQTSWWYTFYLPYSYWNGWTSMYGYYIPMRMNYYAWGWFDDGATPAGTNIRAGQNGSMTSLVDEAYVDNGDGTYTKTGSTSILNPTYTNMISDPDDPNGASTHSGFLINGGANATPTPIAVDFTWSVDPNNVVDMHDGTFMVTVTGDIIQNPEPGMLALIGVAFAGLLGFRRRAALGVS